MKKPSIRQREIDVKIGLLHRQGRSKIREPKNGNNGSDFVGSDVKRWVDKYKDNGLNITFNNNKVTIILPKALDFYHNYDLTALHFNAIRELTKYKSVSYKAYRLVNVNFDYLESISTSAALVLTSELSKWDDAVRNKLRPNIKKWNLNILVNFCELGFFDLFKIKPDNLEQLKNAASPNKKIVKYIKGQCGDDQKTKILKENISKIVGSEINKWRFLHSGLSEAIVNVSHHAYPPKNGFMDIDKNWYLTASYNAYTKELKVVFYDQGIGIPKSLPASALWEKILDSLSNINDIEKRRDEVFLKAAVNLDRTSTKELDRGKGLQDLLEFIRQRKNGYLSILSLKGLFKLEIKDGIETTKSEHFEYPIRGTLIIWSVHV